MKNRAVSFFTNGPAGLLIAAAVGAAILLWVSTVALASISSGNLTTASSTQVTTTNVTITKPSSATGDVMLATIAFHGGSSVVVSGVPSGWTLVRRTDNDASLTLLSYWKANSGSEPSSYTWTVNGPPTSDAGPSGSLG